MFANDLKALIARQARLLAIVAAIAGLALMLGAKPAHAQYGPTSGNLSASTTTPYYTQAVKFTATFSTVNLGPPPFGEVIFYDGIGGPSIGSADLEPENDGTVSITTSSLSTGTHTIIACYQGFGDIPAGSTNTVSVDVAPYGPTTGTISASTSTPDDTQPVTFTATFSTVNLGAPPFGTVEFYEDFSTVIGTFSLEPSDNGTATFTTSSLTPGTHYITAIYEGFGDIPEGGTTNDATVVVSSNEYGPTSGTISASQTYYTGSPITVTVTFSTVNLGPPPFGEVALYDQFSTIIATAYLEPENDGTVTFNVTGSELDTGDNYLTAIYEGFGDIPEGGTSNDVDVYNPD